MATSKHLWILRHAQAEDAPPPGGNDHDRMLSTNGTKQASRLGEAIGSGELPGPVPEIVLVSSASRTRGTAMLAFSGVEPRCEFQVERRIYEAGTDELLSLLAEMPDEVATVAVVGHNPAIAWFGIELVDESSVEHPGRVDHPPATLSVVSLPTDSWSQVAWGTGELLAFRLAEEG